MIGEGGMPNGAVTEVMLTRSCRLLIELSMATDVSER